MKDSAENKTTYIVTQDVIMKDTFNTPTSQIKNSLIYLVEGMKKESVHVRRTPKTPTPYVRLRSNIKLIHKKGIVRSMILKTYLKFSLPISIQ